MRDTPLNQQVFQHFIWFLYRHIATIEVEKIER
uniref:Uncharacterized protein n=1 Tax=Cyanothece sp. (strain PCC 7425 / ATCC 29141) TaxID=395961 RepID=B8HLQ7_CYAP4